jgi:hypothetical protein
MIQPKFNFSTQINRVAVSRSNHKDNNKTLTQIKAFFVMVFKMK